MSVYEKVFDKLEGKSFDVYAPNTHHGDCKSNYVVVRSGSKIPTGSFSSQTAIIDVLCYVPGNRYTDIEAYTNDVKDALRELFPQIIPTGAETIPFYDETIDGWMVSVEYKYAIRNKYIR